VHRGEQTVEGWDGDLPQAQLTERREDVGVGDEAVQPLGAGGPVAAVDVGHRAAMSLSRLSAGTGGVAPVLRSRKASRSRRSA
jgi:hypothetical protein